VLFYALTQGAQFVAIDSQPAATSSLVLSWTPLLVAALAARTITEPPATRQIVGAVLVAGGAFAYFVGDLGATWVGMTAALIGLGANASSALLGRRVNRDGTAGPIVITSVSMAVGSVILLALGLTIEGVPDVSGRAWILITWLAVVNTALAFSLWNLSLQKLSAVESAGINNTMLVQIGLLGWVFLDEPLGPPEIAGIVLVSIGVFLTQAVGRARRSSKV
jgi:drug/metabolite transporter (DMT)-like permease